MILRDRLLDAIKDGRFLEAVNEALRTDDGGIDRLSEEVTRLHNENLIDAIVQFGELRNSGTGGPDFFLVRYVFEKALPHLNAAIDTVLPCVLKLCREADQDLAAGTILNEYVKFCEKDPRRPKEALSLIEKQPSELGHALSATVVAGLNHDGGYFLEQTVRLMGDNDVELRRQATYALSKIVASDRNLISRGAISALSRLIGQEQDDLALGGAVKAVVALQNADLVEVDVALSMVTKALEKGGDQSTHVVSELLWLQHNKLAAPLRDFMLLQLRRVNPRSLGTIRNIDYGIAEIIRHESANAGLDLIENLLSGPLGEVSISNFSSTMHVILREPALLGKVVTRWFVKQEPALWRAAGDMINASHGKQVHINVDPSEVSDADFIRVLFVARKAIGYFFMRPISAASLIVSLMRIAADEETLGELSKLLYDPLLMNYPSGVQSYLKAQSAVESNLVQKTIEDAITSMEQYLKKLRSVPDLPALHPARFQREAYHRHMAAGMAESMRAAQKDSPIWNLFSHSVLLYGNKSITHVHVDDSEPKRMEIPLHSHSVEMEFPRIENIDPFGLNYALRVFRAERILE